MRWAVRDWVGIVTGHGASRRSDGAYCDLVVLVWDRDQNVRMKNWKCFVRWWKESPRCKATMPKCSRFVEEKYCGIAGRDVHGCVFIKDSVRPEIQHSWWPLQFIPPLSNSVRSHPCCILTLSIWDVPTNNTGDLSRQRCYTMQYGSLLQIINWSQNVKRHSCSLLSVSWILRSTSCGWFIELALDMRMREVHGIDRLSCMASGQKYQSSMWMTAEFGLH